VSDNNQRISDAMNGLVDSVMKDFPEVKKILLDKSLTENQAMMKLMEVVRENKDLEGKLVVAGIKALEPLREQKLDVPAAPIMQSPHGGLPRLNPLYEAALIERAQFDGDIPEARTGPLPEGVMPAVPVATDARNPAALGEMLRIASEDMQKDVQAHQRKVVQAIAEGKLDALGLIAKHGEALAEQAKDQSLVFMGSADTDLPAYRRGEVPKPVKVSTPSGSALALMTPEEQRTHAWKFLSTTQGRRTAVTIIRSLVLEILQADGMEVVERDFDPRRQGKVLATKKWVVNLGGAGSTQSAFSFIDVASKVLAKGLLDTLDKTPGPVFLEVISVDQIDVRCVGWAARIVVGG